MPARRMALQAATLLIAWSQWMSIGQCRITAFGRMSLNSAASLSTVSRGAVAMLSTSSIRCSFAPMYAQTFSSSFVRILPVLPSSAPFSPRPHSPWV